MHDMKEKDAGKRGERERDEKKKKHKMGEKISKATAIFYQIVAPCVGCGCVEGGRVSLAQPPRNSIISKYYAERERGGEEAAHTQPTAEIKKNTTKK